MTPVTAQRATRPFLAVAVAWTLLLALLAPAHASASVGEESAFINQVNATRASVGLPALVADVQLTNLARSWAGSMRDGVCGEGNFICHASPISAGVTHNWAKLGENVGTGPDVGSVMNAFVASPGHYANIVDPAFTHIGVGVVWDGNRMFTTHRFMKLQGAPATTTTTAAPTTTTTTAAPATTTQAPSPTTAAPATTQAPQTTAPTVADPAKPIAPTTTTTAPPESSPTDRSLRQPPAALEARAGVLLAAFVSLG